MNEQRIEPGELVAGQYRIDRLVGSGGFAQVYRAVQAELDRTVALKILRPSSDETETSPSKQAVDRFRREAKLVSKLQNPHTVTVYDYGTLPGARLYMVLEYVDGTTLSDLVEREGPLPVDRLVPILVQILDSLREAHALEIVHRDIKPDNIMVFDRIGHRDAVKVLDFGVAKSVAREQSAARRPEAARELTSQGAVIGTPKYMSPEQLMGKQLHPASDLFSVGILAYLMYAGDVPYRSNDSGSILRRMKAFEHDLGALENAPELLKSVAAKLLAPEIEDRYRSADEVLDDLERREGVEMETQPSDSVDNSTSATFPMGLDPEGQTASTELTSVESSRGSEVSRVIVGDSVSAALEEASGSEARRAEAAQEDVVSTETDARSPPENEGSWNATPAFVVGSLLAVATLVIYYTWTVDSPAGSRVAGGAGADVRSQTSPDPRGDRSEKGAPTGLAAVLAGHRRVEEALSTGEAAAREAADLQRDRSREESESEPSHDRNRAPQRPPSASSSDDAPDRAAAGEGRPEESQRAKGSEASDEPEPSVQPLDRAGSEESPSSDESQESGLEVEAWE